MATQVQAIKGENRITLNPAVLAGKPTIRGLRISVDQVLRALGSGVSEKELLDDYPALEREDLLACMLYAADLIENERVYVIDNHEDSH